MFLEHVKKHAETPKKYHILLIVTDGNIHDMSASKRTLVELSDYPCSIIIIGVGEEDFSDMQALDSDKKKLKDRYVILCDGLLIVCSLPARRSRYVVTKIRKIIGKHLKNI